METGHLNIMENENIRKDGRMGITLGRMGKIRGLSKETEREREGE